MLFRPLEVKGKSLRNRIVMPPMVTRRKITAEDGIAWYGEHAAGGVALAIVEATGVPGFGEELTAEKLKPLVDAIHSGGALAAIQLFPIAFGQSESPAGLSSSDIERIIQQYRSAAGICAAAGFDGVEPHGAHGYLLNQFFSTSANARKDAYGESLQNRMRLGLEVTRACVNGAGPDMIILYRHTPRAEAGYTLEESVAFAKELVMAGVDILDMSPSSADAPGDLAQPFVELGVPVITVGRLDQVERAVEAIEDRRADLVAVGRGLIADPKWAEKVREGRLDEIVECVGCDEMCFGNLREGKPIACMQW